MKHKSDFSRRAGEYAEGNCTIGQSGEYSKSSLGRGAKRVHSNVMGRKLCFIMPPSSHKDLGMFYTMSLDLIRHLIDKNIIAPIPLEIDDALSGGVRNKTYADALKKKFKACQTRDAIRSKVAGTPSMLYFLASDERVEFAKKVWALSKNFQIKSANVDGMLEDEAIERTMEIVNDRNIALLLKSFRDDCRDVLVTANSALANLSADATRAP